MTTKMSPREIEVFFRDKVKSYFPFLYITVSLSNLERIVDDANHTVSMFRAFRLQAIERYKTSPSKEIEYQADCFLFSQCVVSALLSMANVLVSVKNNKNGDAWDFLIDSYEYLDIANVFIKKYPHNESESLNSLNQIEDTCKFWERAFFPRLSYTSAGFTATVGKCSVCLNNFILCEHVEGYIYHGIFCQRIDRSIIEANHLALVKNPQDRRCIIESSHDENGYLIDVFTRERIEGQTEPKPQEFKARVVSYRGLNL